MGEYLVKKPKKKKKKKMAAAAVPDPNEVNKQILFDKQINQLFISNLSQSNTKTHEILYHNNGKYMIQ